MRAASAEHSRSRGGCARSCEEGARRRDRRAFALLRRGLPLGAPQAPPGTPTPPNAPDPGRGSTRTGAVHLARPRRGPVRAPRRDRQRPHRAAASRRRSCDAFRGGRGRGSPVAGSTLYVAEAFGLRFGSARFLGYRRSVESLMEPLNKSADLSALASIASDEPRRAPLSLARRGDAVASRPVAVLSVTRARGGVALRAPEVTTTRVAARDADAGLDRPHGFGLHRGPLEGRDLARRPSAASPG